jgi:hypothetical protein
MQRGQKLAKMRGSPTEFELTFSLWSLMGCVTPWFSPSLGWRCYGKCSLKRVE